MIVLDTHAWLWWVSAPGRLGRAAARAIRGARGIGVPAVCCLEVAVAAARGRIGLDRPILEWLNGALALPRVVLVPLSPAVAVKAAELPPSFPGDPADRMIVATAILESALLVTRDDRIQGYPGVRTVWT